MRPEHSKHMAMPRGQYPAQGLVPLGRSSAEQSPGKQSDGRLVCRLHGLTVCPRCGVDFSFTARNAAWDGEAWVPPITQGTGRAFPLRFVPPSEFLAPLQLFSGRRRSPSGNRFRFCHRDDDGALLVFTDGACLSNGRAEPRAAWAFVAGEDARGALETRAGRLERRGPFGAPAAQTNNRAELRAVVAALRARFWPAEGVHTVVVATDSEYVVEGGTTWARDWVWNAWRTQNSTDVKNRDLWQALLGEVEQCARHGLAIQFWRVPRAWNGDADAAAKEAAVTHAAENYWVDASRRRW